MGRKILCFSLVCALIFGVFSVGYCQKNSLSKKEIERIVGEVARKRGIPSVILKSVAKTESSFTQFTPSGKIYASRGGNIGIMQNCRRIQYIILKPEQMCFLLNGNMQIVKCLK